MSKAGSRASLFLAFCMLGMILLSLFSSIMLFRQISNLQIGPDRSELVFFMRQYQYELLRTHNAFISFSYDHQDADNIELFEKWFNILWSRTDSIELGELGGRAIDDGFDVKILKQHIQRIDQLLFIDTVTDAGIFESKLLFNQLIESSHSYQQQRDFLNRDVALMRQHKTYLSYRNSITLSIITFLIAVVMVFYLFRNNKKLSNLRETLEERVFDRTKELRNSNLQLKGEIEERKKTEDQLKSSRLAAESAKEKVFFQANFDMLTKLANRNLFLERFDQAIYHAEQNKQLVALLFLDLDRFKHINDTLGHTIGDKLLREASRRLLDILRSNDTAARFGGDEFAVIISDINDIHIVDMIVGRILETLSAPFRLSGNDAFVSASIGITIYPNDGDNTETLLRKADSAMYKAKERGRNNFQYFTQAMDIEAHRRRELEAALYKAVDEKQFSLNFQPIINGKEKSIVGAEVLLRWEHPELGFISPADFIPLAEEIGLIIQIGEWVLRESCLSAARWSEMAEMPLTLAVNISSRQFQSGNISDLIQQVLNETGLAPELLTIEITEGLLMSDEQQILDQLNLIRKLGVGLAIDDFGTGYSSLSYLKKFPISILKIDQSFIKDISLDKNDDELIKGIISMAQNLNLHVVAEGVENKLQSEFLIENNCLLIQGYYYSKPLSALAFNQYIHRGVAIDCYRDNNKPNNQLH